MNSQKKTSQKTKKTALVVLVLCALLSATAATASTGARADRSGTIHVASGEGSSTFHSVSASINNIVDNVVNTVGDAGNVFSNPQEVVVQGPLYPDGWYSSIAHTGEGSCANQPADNVVGIMGGEVPRNWDIAPS